MKVIISGAGRTGSMLAGLLADGGHQVTVIDLDRRAFGRLPKARVDSGEVRVIEDDGASSDAMEDAGIKDADAFVATTRKDTLNGLAALKAKLTYRVKHVVCKIEDEDLRGLYEPAGIVVVNPAHLGIEQVLASLQTAPPGGNA